MSVKTYFPVVLSFFLSLTLNLQSKPSEQAAARDLASYDTIGPFVVGDEPGFEKDDKAMGKIRSFIWEHRKERHRGWLSATFITIEGDKTTSKFFIEPDESGDWHLIIDSESMIRAVLPKRQRPKRIIQHGDYDQLDWVERECAIDKHCVSVNEKAVQDPPRYLLLLQNKNVGARELL